MYLTCERCGEEFPPGSALSSAVMVGNQNYIFCFRCFQVVGNWIESQTNRGCV